MALNIEKGFVSPRRTNQPNTQPNQVGGFLAVGCWMHLDYTTRRRRSSAIDSLIQDEWEGFQRWMEYKDVDFAVRRSLALLPNVGSIRYEMTSRVAISIINRQQNVRRVCGGNIVALMSNDDPYRGLDDGGLCNKRDWEEMVGARVVMRQGKGHFNSPRLDAEDLDFVEREFLGLERRPKGAAPRDEEEEGGGGGGGGREETKKLKRGQFRSRL